MRLLMRLSSYVAAGFVAAVLVAWGIALWTPDRPAGGGARRIVGSSLSMPVRVPSDLPAPIAYVDREGPRTKVRLLYRSPEFDCQAMIYVAASGFPLPCLASTNFDVVSAGEMGFITEPGWRYGISAESFRIPSRRHRVIPLAPIPGALAVNTAAFALTLLGLSELWRQLRLRRRRASGRCMGCGYRMGPTGVCPECGHSAASAKPA